MTATTEPGTAGARRWLSQQLRGQRLLLTAAIGLGLLEALATLGQLTLFAWLIDRVITRGQALASLLPMLTLLPAMILLRAFSQYGRERVAQSLARRIRASIRQQLTTHWGRVGPALQVQQSPAALSTALLEQVDALDGYYARYLPQAALAFLVPLAVLALVLSLDWLAALFLFLAAPLIPLFMALVGMGADSLNRRHFSELAWLSGHFLDRIRHLTTLRLFSQTTSARAQVGSASHRFRRLNMKTLRLAFLSSAVLEFFASVAIALVAIYIGFGLLDYISFGPSDDLTLYSGLLILLLAPEFFQPLRQFAQHYHDRAKALGAAAHLYQVIPHIARPPKAAPRRTLPDPLPGSLVKGTHISFQYPGQTPVLQELNLSVRPGEWVALAGPSGAGKSTLLRLLAGFIQPTRGRLEIAGQAPSCWRLAWLDQHPWLPQASWRELLTSTLEDPPGDATLYAALEMVGLHERLRHEPAGLDSLLPERGYGLSGGQARRLALARQYLSGQRLFLLDEPTGGLDPTSARQVTRALVNLQNRGGTLVTISHDATTLARADRVLTLTEGRVHAL